MAIKKCPHCSGDVFQAKIIKAGKVTTNEHGAFVIEEQSVKYNIEVVRCGSCKADITNADLIEMAICTKCSNPTLPNLLDENKVCDVCQAINNRPNLANASKEDLIRMLLKLEQSSVIETIPAKIKKAEKTLAEKEEKLANDTSDEKVTLPKKAEEKLASAKAAINEVISQENITEEDDLKDKTKVDDDVEKAPKLTKRKTVKRKTQPDSEVEEEELKTAPNATEAPFPDKDINLESNMPAQEEVIQEPNKEDSTDVFKMFEEEDSF